MRSSTLLLLFVPFVAACASAGGGAPSSDAGSGVSYQPGRYRLEASITNQEGVTRQTAVYSADLAIAADGAMTLRSTSGAACQDLTPLTAGQDALRAQKRFKCGDESYRLRPGAPTPTGDIEVAITIETIENGGCVPVNNIDSRCAGGPDKTVKSTKQVRAQLRVLSVQ